MPTVNFTSALNRFFPDLKTAEIKATSISEALNQLEIQYPGIKDYLVDEDGTLRKHINIFIGNQLIKDREHLTDLVNESDEILVFQALSGG